MANFIHTHTPPPKLSFVFDKTTYSKCYLFCLYQNITERSNRRPVIVCYNVLCVCLCINRIIQFFSFYICYLQSLLPETIFIFTFSSKSFYIGKHRLTYLCIAHQVELPCANPLSYTFIPQLIIILQNVSKVFCKPVAFYSHHLHVLLHFSLLLKYLGYYTGKYVWPMVTKMSVLVQKCHYIIKRIMK